MDGAMKSLVFLPNTDRSIKSDIPMRPYEEFKARYPDYALLFGWNHAEEIMAKEQAFKTVGGKWIVYVPEVKVL